MKIWIVDSFAGHPYKGNPAAVMIVEEFPSDKECLNIAAEMNLSETAFIKKIDRNHFYLRWFTPKVEVKLCGHGTLAAAHVLREEKAIEGDEILFESLSGPLRVYCSLASYTLDFPLQKIGDSIDSPVLRHLFKEKIAAVQAYDDIIVEMASESEVRSYLPSSSDLLKIDCRGIILTAKGEGKYDFVSRFFAPRVGVNEDPVTGSMHCKLAHYWHLKLQKSHFLAYQASERGGEIELSIVEDRVHLTGSAITILKGEWQVPIEKPKSLIF